MVQLPPIPGFQKSREVWEEMFAWVTPGSFNQWILNYSQLQLGCRSATNPILGAPESAIRNQPACWCLKSHNGTGKLQDKTPLASPNLLFSPDGIC